MKPKTEFIKILEKIHSKTDMRYGQILNDALQLHLGRHDCDCGKDWSVCKCENVSGAAHDTFFIDDKTMTDAVKRLAEKLNIV